MTIRSYLLNASKALLNYQDTSPQTKIEKTRHYYPQGEGVQQLTTVPRTELGNLAASEPMFYKGTWKQNKDIFGEGWELQNKDPEIEVDDIDLDLVNDFNKKAQLKYKLEQTGISANIYGDGFLEIIFEEPKATKISQDIPVSAPVDLNVMQAKYISTTEKRKFGNQDEIEYYIFKDIEKQYIHPNRVCHVVKKRLPGERFGISDVYTCQRILKSMMNADLLFGDTIEWAGKGVFDVCINGMNDTELRDAEKKIERKNVLIHNEDTVWQVHNPSVMSPKEYYDYFFIKIAAVFDMPQHILTGVQPGQLTGSEIGLADYYKSIINYQELIFTPVLERIYGLLLKGNGRTFDDYEIAWNPIYIDETSEADILMKFYRKLDELGIRNCF